MRFVCTLFATVIATSLSNATDAADVVFKEVNGIVAVEAEHFNEQTKTEKRAFHLTSSEQTPDIEPDGDPSHIAGASGGAYLEVLPDTRRTHADKLIHGQNFSNLAGKLAVLHYKVNIANPGRYYVWVRAHSTGSEDNGLHVGLDGEWPESGQRLQWCEGKKQWWWESKQRTEKQHCGERYKIFLDIADAGDHTITFSMREDGFEFDKWLMTTNRDFNRPSDIGPNPQVHSGKMPKAYKFVAAPKQLHAKQGTPVVAIRKGPLVQPRQPHGDGKVAVSGELKQWHKITLTLNGPYAHEQDNKPNPFTDYCMNVEFQHDDGTEYLVPGYFAADGKAGTSSKDSGTAWRVNFAPDRVGKWSYRVAFTHGRLAALGPVPSATAFAPFDGVGGSFTVRESDKDGRDLRGHGRLQYVGKPYLQFAGSKKYFLKAGADAPETLLGYADFDNTIAGKAAKVPLKTWAPHVRDWRDGDPIWKDGKGKGLIGAINYLAGKGCNAFSFLTYNAGGDGDNVWPFVHRDDKLNYDCSKLDQWGIVFDHATAQGMYLHFKMQETEIDDNQRGHKTASHGKIPESLDGGELGVERKLYCRELIARFGHNLALNWNLGEENTQTTAQQKAMINYIADLDAYDHNIVIHTYPDQQDKIYGSLIGDKSRLTGLSIQNSNIRDTHWQTVKWSRKAIDAGKPWIVAFDESGSAAHGQCPDLGYKGFDGKDRTGKFIYTEHEVRKQTLWGTLMGGGAGVEYYFGYQFAENDLICEDWRSRDHSWDYCRIAINFFHDNDIPFWNMTSQDELVGNEKHDNSVYCLAAPNNTYLVYKPNGGETKLNLSAASGEFGVAWFNPRSGGSLAKGTVDRVAGGESVSLGSPPNNAKEDWVILVRRKSD